MLPVLCDEVGSGDTISVRHDKIVTIRCQDSLVQDPAFLKSVVLLPDMLDLNRTFTSESLDNGTSFCFGSIISDYDFMEIVVLSRPAPKYFFQPDW